MRIACWGCAGAGLAAVGVVAWRWRLRRWAYTWGATVDEVRAVLPGDELVDHADTAARTTRAVTIAAPPERVWPWLAQIGEDRAGFYSYDILERAVGARIHNADRVHPEWQELAPGDTVWLARRFGEVARQVVTAVEPGADLVLMSAADHARWRAGRPAHGVWSFHLRGDGDGTRLLARGVGGSAGGLAFDVAHFVMERAMLLGIRNRVLADLATGG
ncbi:MAG: hypothetical protein U0R18_04640 [Mycobacterium sp.]